MKKTIPERIKNWAKAIMAVGVAAIIVLAATTIGLDLLGKDVSSTVDTINRLTPSITRLVGVQ